MKCCIECNVEKDDGEFPSERNTCKLCRKEQKKQYYQNNREAIKEREKRYRQNNRKAIEEREKRYRQNNRKAIEERKKQYYQNNAEAIKQYRQNNREAIKEQKKQYYQNNLHKHLLKGAQKRAKQKNLPFNLNEEDIVIPPVCPVLGISLEAGVGKGSIQSNSPTIDRIVPEKGYVKDNIIIISSKANTIKSNATPEQIIAVGEFYKNLVEQKEEQNVVSS